MTLHPKLAGVRSSLILVPAALAVLFLAGWRRATLNAAPQPALTASAAVTEATITFPFQGRARSAVLIVPTAAPPATGFPVALKSRALRFCAQNSR